MKHECFFWFLSLCSLINDSFSLLKYTTGIILFSVFPFDSSPQSWWHYDSVKSLFLSSLCPLIFSLEQVCVSHVRFVFIVGLFALMVLFLSCRKSFCQHFKIWSKHFKKFTKCVLWRNTEKKCRNQGTVPNFSAVIKHLKCHLQLI